ncbi:NAD(P)-dependent oxidoreductase [Quadrisphaera sp. KR29]|uniref:NAD(P)-dependent oxidoreductase n=1 Tax=Quadrisphaera sp. KR29 TaxID=3461391 RepID=UPI004043D4B5
MDVVVFGAAGAVGGHAVRLLLGRGHGVVAVARRTIEVPPGSTGGTGGTDGTTGTGRVRQVTGDVRDAAVVEQALDGADAVLWCVGVTKTSGGDVGRSSLPAVVTAAARTGARRLVAVSGAGADLPGDRKGAGARLVSTLMHRVARDVVEDREAEHALLAGSDLDWTQVRPPRLVERPGAGRYLLTTEAPGLRSPALAKADVALAMVDLVEGREWLGAAPFLVAARP